MKFILFISMLLGIFCEAQLSKYYLQNRGEAERAIKAKNWDNTIIYGTYLIAEEPLQPAGYYYLALGSMKKMNIEDAQKANQRLFIYGDDDWKAKSKTLEQQIDQLSKILTSYFKKENLGKLTAQQWYEIWQIDKTELDYALNAAELFMENNEFIKADNILRDSSLRYLSGINSLRSDLRTDKKVQVNDEAEKNLKSGDYLVSEGKFADAVKFYEKLLKLEPKNDNVQIKLNKAKEEAAWKNAIQKKTVEAYEVYLNNDRFDKYRDRAFAEVVDLIKVKIKDLARTAKVVDAEKYFDMFANRYSLNKQSRDEINDVMCKMYDSNIEKLRNFNNDDDRKQILNLYYKSRTKCVLTDAQKKEIIKLEKLLKKAPTSL